MLIKKSVLPTANIQQWLVTDHKPAFQWTERKPESILTRSSLMQRTLAKVVFLFNHP